jgi:hypothetical protein
MPAIVSVVDKAMGFPEARLGMLEMWEDTSLEKEIRNALERLATDRKL